MEQTGEVSNSVLFAGYQFDKETGLYYLNARMYDPVTARFMQEDTVAGQPMDPLSLNLYTYCHNSPLMYWDPTGHSAESITINGKTYDTSWIPTTTDAKTGKVNFVIGNPAHTAFVNHLNAELRTVKSELQKTIKDLPKEKQDEINNSMENSKDIFAEIDSIYKNAKNMVANQEAKGAVTNNKEYDYDQTGYVYNEPKVTVEQVLLEIFEETPDLTEYEIAFILEAVTWLGTPYEWAGPVKNKYCDCGGFARGLFEELKYSIGWNGNSGNQLNKDGSIGRTSNEMWTAMPMEGSRYDINGGYTGEIIVNNPYREVEYSINGKGTVKRESSPKLVTSRDPESWDWSSLRPGDVIFFDTKGNYISDKNYKASDGYVDHVAIYLGGNYLIQTWTDETNLVITPINPDLSLSSKTHIVGVKRYLPQD